MENKKISISGINNKYQMKKLVQNRKEEEKQRIVIQSWSLYEDYYLYSKQLVILPQLLQCINLKEEKLDYIRIFIQEIERKISSYRQQDLIKSILNPEKFICLSFIIEKLIECSMKCFYCQCEMLVLYKNVREPKQWTVDRVNNCNGHNKDNIVLSCLECNLKRRNKSKDSFLFTKQLKIVRENFDEN